jgi:C_GCAxxG_C_C family probable redox protein
MGKVQRSREAALAAFQDQSPEHLNCAQAVVLCAAVLQDQDPKVVALANYMGGGSVGMGQMCGAVAGAVLALGIRDYLAPDGKAGEVPENKKVLQQLIADFETEFGGLTCRGLTGHDMRTKEGYAKFKADPISEKCADYVAWVCDRLGPAL